MATPLAPLQNTTLNRSRSPVPPADPQKHRFASDDYEVVLVSSVQTTTAATITTTTTTMDMDAPSPASSSPFVHSVAPSVATASSSPAKDGRRPSVSSSSENRSPHAAAAAAAAKPAAPPVLTGRQARPGSRILSGSELSPLKILQGRVTGGPPSSSAASTATTVGSPASPDSGAESRRDLGDDQASSAASSPPPSFPPHQHEQQQQHQQQQQQQPQPQPQPQLQRRMSTSTNPLLAPALPLGRTPRKSPDKRFPVKISVPPVAAAATAAAAAAAAGSPSVSASPVGAQSPKLPHQPQHHAPAQPLPASPSIPGQTLLAQIQRQPLHGRQISLDEAIQLNEGLKQAIEIFEDETSSVEDGNDDDNNTQKLPADRKSQHHHQHQHQHQHQNQRPLARRGSSAQGAGAHDDDDAVGMDDTMTSTFSSFSAVPNLAMLSRGTSGTSSPSKAAAMAATASANGHGAHHRQNDTSSARTPRANGHGGPLPNRTAHYEAGNTTSLLMDFTEQLRFAHSQQQSPSKGRFGAAAAAGGPDATPRRKSLVNLLDFEIPPLPTPRSIPTVTPRELESLKSNFLSEISSLKASLSGKEAEVLALKTAVGDAEKRVGACMEQLREERGARDLLAEERDQWERRGREMEEVLRKVKGEIVLGHRDRDELEAKLDEAEKRREAAEMMAQEAETKMAAMRAGRATAEAADGKTRSPSGGAPGSTSAVQREVEIAVERVARELHVAYKAKHETKVAALKKSYEARWEKRVRELEAAAEALAEENEKLRIGRDATLTRMAAPGEEERRAEEARRQREARDAAQIKELGAEVEKLEAVVRTVQADNSELRTLLEQERVEKGELVILAEELMAMQQSFLAGGGGPGAGAGTGAAAAATASSSSSAASPSRHAASPSRYAESPRKPKTPAPRASVSGISRPPSRPPSSNGNYGASHGSSHGSSSSTTTTTGGASTATTPGRTRPMSMHGTGRVSGLKPPSSSTMSTGGVPSRIGRLGHDRKMSGSGGSLPRPPSGLGTRSGLMSSIEKMGNYRGRAE